MGRAFIPLAFRSELDGKTTAEILTPTWYRYEPTADDQMKLYRKVRGALALVLTVEPVLDAPETFIARISPNPSHNSVVDKVDPALVSLPQDQAEMWFSPTSPDLPAAILLGPTIANEKLYGVPEHNAALYEQHGAIRPSLDGHHGLHTALVVEMPNNPYAGMDRLFLLGEPRMRA